VVFGGPGHIRFAVITPALSAVSHIYRFSQYEAAIRLNVGVQVLQATKSGSTPMKYGCNGTLLAELDPRNS